MQFFRSRNIFFLIDAVSIRRVKGYFNTIVTNV